MDATPDDAVDPLDADLTGLIRDGEHLPDDAVPRPASRTPTVSTSLRLKVDVFTELQDAARERGVGHVVLAQQLIEAGLAQLRADRSLVPLADVQLALARLARRTPPAA